jgi:aspartate aminotransferase
MRVMHAPVSDFARSLVTETAFDVLAIAKQLKARGKDVIELQIGDSPFESSPSAVASGIEAIRAGETHYCASHGLPDLRGSLAASLRREFGLAVGPENIVVGPGAKVFEQFFCELFLDPGDAVLLFSPQFPTYEPNIRRRGARPILSALKADRQFRPDLDDVELFVKSEPRAKAIFLNSPHNPTGGVASAEDIQGIANVIRGRPIALFSDEPYCHMIWHGRHHSILAETEMLEQCIAAYTFSKSYSMSGWRLGFAVAHARYADVFAKMINTSLSCVPPFVQLAGNAAILMDSARRDETMLRFQKKVELLVAELQKVPDVKVTMPAGTFYVFPDVTAICNRLQLRTHGLAMYLLEGADEKLGVACLGGECFGEAGSGFLRLSCAEPDQRLVDAVAFIRDAVNRTERVRQYRESHPAYRA